MIKKQRLRAKINCIIIAFIILCACFFPTLQHVRADVEYPFDSTGALEDLLTLDNFNIEDYPEDRFGLYKKPEVITMMEFGYSPISTANTGYSIYIYFYNPTLLDINVNSPLDTVQLAIEYDTSPVTRFSNPTNYQKFGLEYCDAYTAEEYAGRFLKFRVMDTEDENGKILSERVNPEIRRYDISGLTLYTKTGDVKEYEFERTTYWTGYAAGMNGNLESTLKSDFSWLETVRLDVRHTFWRRPAESDAFVKDGWQTQIDTVYFSVPNTLLTKYGKLQRIKADWYEYFAQDIIVTSDKAFYNEHKDYIGESVASKNLPRGLIDEWYDKNDYGIPQGAEWEYNSNVQMGDVTVYKLNYLLPTNNWSSIKEYDPYASHLSGDVTANDLYKYIRDYKSSTSTETVETRYGPVSAELFAKDIPSKRKMDNERGKIQKGYSYYDFDIDADIFDVGEKPDSDDVTIKNAIQIYTKYGIMDVLTGSFVDDVEDVVKDVAPIDSVSKEDLSEDFTDKAIASKLLVNVNDVKNLRQAYNDATEQSQTLFLFRFAKSDYYSAPLIIHNTSAPISNLDERYKNNAAYRVHQSVFLDFDIIQLTFSDKGQLTVVPVVADPIDIVNPPTPPTELGKTPFESFLNLIGSWGTLISLIVAGLVLLYLAGKLLELFKSVPNKVISGILITLLIAGLVVAFWFGISWGINVITDLGGLL